MFISAKSFFEDNTANNAVLIRQAETAIPEEFIKLFKKNVVNITPKKTGALRRSIITQVLGNKAQIGWRSPYAVPQNNGGHTVRSRRVVNIGGQFVTLKPKFYRYSTYTTPGTGPNFAQTAFRATREQMPEALRARGVTR